MTTLTDIGQLITTLKMTQIRLYLDVDVVSTGEAQMLSRSDEEQLRWSLENQHIYEFL